MQPELLEEDLVIRHRSPVSLENGYRPVVARRTLGTGPQGTNTRQLAKTNICSTNKLFTSTDVIEEPLTKHVEVNKLDKEISESKMSDMQPQEDHSEDQKEKKSAQSLHSEESSPGLLGTIPIYLITLLKVAVLAMCLLLLWAELLCHAHSEARLDQDLATHCGNSSHRPANSL